MGAGRAGSAAVQPPGGSGSIPLFRLPQWPGAGEPHRSEGLPPSGPPLSPNALPASPPLSPFCASAFSADFSRSADCRRLPRPARALLPHEDLWDCSNKLCLRGSFWMVKPPPSRWHGASQPDPAAAPAGQRLPQHRGGFLGAFPSRASQGAPANAVPEDYHLNPGSCASGIPVFPGRTRWKRPASSPGLRPRRG